MPDVGNTVERFHHHYFGYPYSAVANGPLFDDRLLGAFPVVDGLLSVLPS